MVLIDITLNFYTMKTIKKIVLVVAVLFATQIFAQSNANVYAVVSKASWCPTCVKNEARVASEVLSKVDGSKVTILVNDLSDKKTKSASAATLKEKGLDKINLKSTGIISFIDAKTKKVIGTISVSKSSEAILEEFNKLSI
jgi:hypothetical protein